LKIWYHFWGQVTVAEILGEQQPTPLRRVGWRDVDAESAPNQPLLEKYGLTAEHIAETAQSLLGA
jgi:transketolase